jgi:hypothetical protein
MDPPKSEYKHHPGRIPAEQKEPGHPLERPNYIKSNHRFVPPFSTQPTVQLDQKEQNLRSALADFKAGKFSSEAARAYDVPPSTFNDRLNGKKRQ